MRSWIHWVIDRGWCKTALGKIEQDGHGVGNYSWGMDLRPVSISLKKER